MASTTSNSKNEIESLLHAALPKQDINDYNVEIVGTSAKGDGFIGDIYFVNLTSTKKNYNFVVKCGKSSAALRKSAPVKAAFEQEIFIFNTVFPAFRKFELEQNIDDVFNSVPKCYGTFTRQGKEVIVLENLKTLGYELWDKKSPLPRNYIESVLKQYGRWHAISAAMQDQKPEIFGKLVNNMLDVWAELCNSTNFPNSFVKAVEETGNIWDNELAEDILNEWQQLKDHTEFYIKNFRKPSKSFNVITHGDCWNNNFMFKTTSGDGKSKEVEVAILDWQLSGFSSPVIDLSYFLYTCISNEDLQDFDELLKVYYKSFAEYMKKMGSNAEKIYTYSNLLDDWKIYGRLGILHAALAFPVIYAEKDDIPDIVEVTENGGGFGSAFCTNIKNVNLIKQRLMCIIRHAVERELIKPIKYF